MGIYYTISAQGLTSNSSAATETDHLRTLTQTTRSAAFVQIIVTARNASVGGGSIRVRRFTTPSTSGSQITPVAKDPGGQASTILADTGPTAGGTPTQVTSVGFSQTGAQGFWGAAEPNDAILLNANGGANGNLDFLSVCNGTSVPLDLTTEHIE